MAQAAAERTAARELLAIYLRDHRAGAAGGLQLVRRCRRHAGADELAATLAWLETQIDEDRQSLEEIMDELDIEQSRLKEALSVAAERAGRLKLNGRLWKRSPLSTLLELEALAAAVYTKRNLWYSLSAIAERSAVGDPRRLAELIDRATAQLERVQAHHGDAARLAFDAPASGTVDEPSTAAAPAAQSTGPDTRATGEAVSFEPPGARLDQLLQDAEGGIEGSLLDAPDDADSTPT